MPKNIEKLIPESKVRKLEARAYMWGWGTAMVGSIAGILVANRYGDRIVLALRS